jgi:hypothetical protein
MNKAKMIVLALLAMSPTLVMAGALAGAGDGGKIPAPPTAPKAPAQPISWQEFQARCANPASFDQQVAPANITIQCTDVTTEWVPENPGTIELPTSQVISAQITSDKWVVGDNGNYKTDGASSATTKGASCLRYKEIADTLTTESTLSCSDILGLKGSIDDYCQGEVSSAKGLNSKLGSVVETGRVIDTCAGLSNSGVTVNDPNGDGNGNGGNPKK